MSTDFRIGSRGAEVGNWQRFLNGQLLQDAEGKSLVVDEKFGVRTDYVTKLWQMRHGLHISGTVGQVERHLAQGEGFIPFVQARNYTPSNRTLIDVIVIHDMEYPETPQGAEWCAAFFGGASAPRASAHFAVDNDSMVQCVRERDVAWHAPGANHNGIGIELTGYAKQSRAQWLDEYSLAELRRCAKLVAMLCKRWMIPIGKIAPDELRAGVRGICGHVDATLAFPGPGRTHYDPGKGFPWDEFITLVRSAPI